MRDDQLFGALRAVVVLLQGVQQFRPKGIQRTVRPRRWPSNINWVAMPALSRNPSAGLKTAEGCRMELIGVDLSDAPNGKRQFDDDAHWCASGASAGSARPSSRLLLSGHLVAGPLLRETVLLSSSHLGAGNAQDPGRFLVVRRFGDMAYASVRLHHLGATAVGEGLSPADRGEAEVESEAKLSSAAPTDRRHAIESARLAFCCESFSRLGTFQFLASPPCAIGPLVCGLADG